MIDEIIDFDAHLVIGEEPARRRLGALGDTDDPLVWFERLRTRQRDLARALAAIRREPVSVLRARRQFVPLRDTRRADLRTLRSALRQPATLAAIRPGAASKPYAPGSEPILDVPAVERTLDSPANRCILAMVHALRLRCRELGTRLDDLAEKPPVDTKTPVANRVDRWNQILGEMTPVIRNCGAPPAVQRSASSRGHGRGTQRGGGTSSLRTVLAPRMGSTAARCLSVGHTGSAAAQSDVGDLRTVVLRRVVAEAPRVAPRLRVEECGPDRLRSSTMHRQARRWKPHHTPFAAYLPQDERGPRDRGLVDFTRVQTRSGACFTVCRRRDAIRRPRRKVPRRRIWDPQRNGGERAPVCRCAPLGTPPAGMDAPTGPERHGNGMADPHGLRRPAPRWRRRPPTGPRNAGLVSRTVDRSRETGSQETPSSFRKRVSGTRVKGRHIRTGG